MKFDKQTMDWILYFLIISLIGVILVALVTVDKNSIQCLSNPIQYYEQMKNLSCVCAEELPQYILRP